MAILNNKSMIIRKMPWHANMTEMNHLGAALLIKPSVFKTKFDQLFSTHLYSGNPLESLRRMGLVGSRTEANRMWEWKMKAANSRPLVIIENVEPAAASYGKYNRPFKIKLDEDWWLPGDYAFPGTNDKSIQIRIQEKVGRRGNGCIYIVQTTGDKNASIPAKFFAPGQQWTKLFSKYEEGAEQSGSTQYALPVELTNRMSRYRKTYKVTGDVHNEVLAVKIPDSTGKIHDTWIKYAEAEFWQQWYYEQSLGDWFSYSNVSTVGSTNRMVDNGPGVQEMIGDGGHIWRPSHVTARGFEEYIMDIYFGRRGFGKRNIGCFTGEYGMIEAHRFMTDVMQKHGFAMGGNNFDYVQKTSSEYHSNAYSVGFKFTEWKMTNGATVTFYHNPLYDDRTLNYEIDPVTGYPMASLRYTFLDFMNGEGGANIELVNKTNSFKHWYVAGGTSPYGNVNKGLGSHSGDYYEVHIQDEHGVHIHDITRCGEIIVTRKS